MVEKDGITQSKSRRDNTKPRVPEGKGAKKLQRTGDPDIFTILGKGADEKRKKLLITEQSPPESKQK